jgi:hypothetical protein
MQVGICLGELTAPTYDQPFVFCTIPSTLEFEQFRPWFDEELRLLFNSQLESYLKPTSECNLSN